MDQHAAHGQSRLLEGLRSPERERAAVVLTGATTIPIDGGLPYFPTSFAAAAFLVVEHGVVVVRATAPAPTGAVVTSDGGPGAIVLPPRAEEMLSGLGGAAVTVIPAEVRDRLLTFPTVARRVAERLAFALEQRQEAIANLAPTRHVERVRRKLFQLARGYGHVTRDGIRIDFPISHALLAQMIGSSRETVTRALDELQRGGLVARAGSTYSLLVPAGLVFDAGADLSTQREWCHVG
jgi:hypothetical protein